jgi:DNA polymerase-3 subunit gamma/tau
MSYQVLARKWRPKKFQDVIGQSHITRSLQNAILREKIGHAYMFVGTRGVGKTSVARIFAKAIRCENRSDSAEACNECKACLDFDTDTSMNVIEIDGASNNSVDNIRELISNVHYLPTSGKYKVYIIDEVHMLSTSAFNALLKTLEEPPAHVVFIFATTEAQKLLGTVLSRCQRFDFRNVPVQELVSHVKEIAKTENIKFESDDLIKQLAVLGNGSVRDTLSLMDQVLTFSENNYVKEEVFTSSLGVAGPTTIKELVSSILNGQLSAVQKIYHQLLFENISLKNILSAVLDQLYLEIKTNKNFSEAELIWVYESLAKETIWVFDSLVPDKTIEVLFVKVCNRRNYFNLVVAPMSAPLAQSIEKVEVNIPVEEKKTPAISLSELMAEIEVETALENKNQAIVAETIIEQKSSADENPEILMNKDLTWDGFLNFLISRSPASASNLEQGNLIKPLMLENGELYLELGFNFAGTVFLDYLRESEVFQKVVSNLSEFFSVSKDKVHLSLVEVKEEADFVSKADLRQIEAENNLNDRVEQFKKNPMLQEAERIFNSKIDKVIIEPKK